VYYTPGTFDLAALRRQVEADLRAAVARTAPGTPLPSNTVIAQAYTTSQIPRSRVLPVIADAKRARINPRHQPAALQQFSSSAVQPPDASR
jgi:hypothetical protein